jgi:hypothetical protein
MTVKIFLALLILNLNWTIERFANASEISLGIDPKMTADGNGDDCEECKMRLPPRFGKRNYFMFSQLPIKTFVNKYRDEMVKFFWRNKYQMGTTPKQLQSLTSISNTFDFLRQFFDRNKIKRFTIN